MRNKSFMISILVMVLVLSSPLAVLGKASSDNVIVTLAIPDWAAYAFPPDIFKAFESAHPGAKVVIVKNRESYPLAANNLEEHLAGVEAYVGSADVVFVSNSFGGNTLSLEATRAGYFLDITPLLAVDSGLNPNDFYSNIWVSYQWENGIWALPVSAKVNIMIFDPAAFDRAAIAYPHADWMVDDFANTLAALSQSESSGEGIVPAFFAFDPSLFIRSFLGRSFQSTDNMSIIPSFSGADLEHLLEVWGNLQASGSLLYLGSGSFQNVNIDEIPLQIGQISQLINPRRGRAGSLLPGHTAGLEVNGFAISKGTAIPNLSYALIKYLIQDASVANAFGSDIAAKRDLAESRVSEYPAEIQPLLSDAVNNALPVSELLFGEHLNRFLSSLSNEESIQLQLINLEAGIFDALAFAPTFPQGSIFTVATPVPTPDLSSNEITINFGIEALTSPLLYYERWEYLIDEFVSNDPQVGRVILTDFLHLSDPAQYDCFFLPRNVVGPASVQYLLNLDPLLSADPTFFAEDLIGDVLTQVQTDGKTWAMPIVMFPEAIWYDSEAFEQIGLIPDNTWTIDLFINALHLFDAKGMDRPFLVPNNPNKNTHLLLLIAAAGGLPLDYRSNPPELNLTEANTVAAIQTILDLAKEGYIHYEALKVHSFSREGEAAPMYSDTLSPLSWRARHSGNSENTFQVIMYPNGGTTSPISYDIGAAYISKNTLFPEACYRWIRVLSLHPEIFSGTPVFQSLFDEAFVSAVNEGDIVDYYGELNRRMTAYDAITIPGQYGEDALLRTLEEYWLNQAFDNYVLENHDLEEELALAEQHILEFRECAASVYETGTSITISDDDTYLDGLGQCFRSVDSSVSG